MTQQLLTDISRIDKLLVDRDEVAPHQSLALRCASIPTVSAGEDCANSEALQVALLTAVNLAHKSFSAPVPVQLPEPVWDANCLTALSAKVTLGEALQEIGAVRAIADNVDALMLLIGDAHAGKRSLRVTFDGWRVGVGPSDSMPRMLERPYCMRSQRSWNATISHSGSGVIAIW